MDYLSVRDRLATEESKLSNLTLEKRVLYSNVYCAYREFTEKGVYCKHPYSFKTCDLDLCPIVQEKFANILFQADGIYLFVKKPSEDSIAGKWEKYKLEIDLDSPEETINFVKEKAKGINEKNMNALMERLNNIIERYKFLTSRGISVPIITGEEAPLESLLEETEEGEETEETLELLSEEEEEGEELELLDLDEEESEES